MPRLQAPALQMSPLVRYSAPPPRAHARRSARCAPAAQHVERARGSFIHVPARPPDVIHDREDVPAPRGPWKNRLRFAASAHGWPARCIAAPRAAQYVEHCPGPPLSVPAEPLTSSMTERRRAGSSGGPRRIGCDSRRRPTGGLRAASPPRAPRGTLPWGHISLCQPLTSLHVG